MADETVDRLQAELDLLFAMYPDAITFSPSARELRYSHLASSEEKKQSGSLLLRLPDSYPLNGFPEIISATGPQKEDLRSAAKSAFEKEKGPGHEEVIDALLLAFQQLLDACHAPDQEPNNEAASFSGTPGQDDVTRSHKTVIIWLHHLLNTNKRKLALNPSVSDSGIAGLTKPGYPGVLIFSGPKTGVDSHVAELKGQRWQAFQVRYDSEDDQEPDTLWGFHHGAGIREVESMSDIAQDISDPSHRETFLSAIGVR